MTSPLTAAAHVGDFLGPLADERDHQQDLGVVGADAVGDLLEEHRLAGLGRGDDQGALALAERVDQVDQALAEVLGVGLEVDQLDRVDRGQVVEERAAARRVGVDAVDAVDAEQAPVLLAVTRGADDAGDAIADAQAGAAHLAGRDVDVVRAGQQAVAAHEAVALVDDVEDAGRVDLAGVLGLTLEDLVDEIVLADAGRGIELELAPDLAELGDAHLAEVGDIEVVALARRLDLLLLLELADGRAVWGLGTSARTTVAGALIALVWAGTGHLGKITYG